MIIPLPKLYHPDFSSPNVKPSGSVVVDLTNPINKGLKFYPLVEGNNLRDLVSGAIGVVTGTIGSGHDNEGSFVSADGGDNILFADVMHNIGTGPYTIAARYTWDGNITSFQTVMSLPNNSEVGMYWPIRSTQLNLAQDSTTGASTHWGGATVAQDVPATISISSSGAATVPKGYKNGILQAVTISNAHNYAGGTTGVRIFSGQGTEDAHGNGGWFTLWNRQLFDAEQKSLADDLYQLVEPEIPAMFFTASAVVGVNIPVIMNHLRNQGIS